MFSYWLGLAGRKNLKAIGDGNPGAMNLWKARGYPYGLLGILLDFAKGYVSVLWVMTYHRSLGYWMIPLALAPIAGHAFSPFLRGRGGKAIAVTFGVWSALTSFEVSIVYAVLLALLKAGGWWLSRESSSSADSDGLQVVLGMLFVSVYLLLFNFSAVLLLVWFSNFVLLAYTHRVELAAWMKQIVS